MQKINDLNSKVDKIDFDNTISNIESELEELNIKTIPSGGTEGQILKIQNGNKIWSDPGLVSVTFSNEDDDISIPESDNVRSEIFPGGGEIEVI